MVMLKRRHAVLTAGMLAGLAGLNPVLADVPEVLDRVPGNAAIVVTIRNLDQVNTRFTNLATVLNMPIDEEDESNPITMGRKLLGTAGLNKTGSLAFAIMPGADGTVDFESDEGPVVMVVPVSDYAAFVKALGATETTGIASLTIEDKPGFAKDLGGGYAALGPVKEIVEAFEGKAGNKAAHKAQLGTSGRRLADTADILVIANMAALETQMEEAQHKVTETGEMVQMMAGQGGAGATAAFLVIGNAMEAFSRDASIGIVGMGLGENGVSLDFGAQFKEGSASAKLFNAPGKASALLARVPNQPFLFAGAIDLSAPGIKSMFANVKEVMEAKGPGVADEGAPEDEATGEAVNKSEFAAFSTMLQMMEKVNGYSFSVGANPMGIMGGLLVNTSAYVSTSDPAGYLKATRDVTTAMDGQTANGLATTVIYKPNAEDVSGASVDSWSIQMKPDPNDPNAMQMQMMQQWLFGPQGLGGMAAPIDNGVVIAMSQNKMLMASAIDTAKAGNGVSNDELLKKTQATLPDNRTFEFYIGAKSILDAVGGVMAMMGGGAAFEVPAALPPIAIGGTTDGGGIGLRIHMPADVIKALAEVSKAMNQGDEEDMEMGEDEGDAPKF